MPFPRPTLTTLRTQAMQDITASDLPNADGFLRRAALRVLAWVQAGLAYLHYGYLDWISLQSTPFTAEAEFLEAWAALAPTPVIRIPPGFATGSAQWSGTVGADLPAGTPVNSGGGFAYVTTADATVQTTGIVTATVVATVAGPAGNLDSGSPLQLGLVVPQINGAGAASTAIAGGTALETDAAMRTRMLESYAAPPAGGAAADYVTWALEVAGVTRAWTLRNGMGVGTVVVYFMLDVAEAAVGGFPQGTNGVSQYDTRAAAATGDQLALANALWPKQPVTALVYGSAPVAQPVAFTITGLSGATTQQKAAATAALVALFVEKGSPLADTPIEQSDVDGALNAVPGLPIFAVTVPSAWPLLPAVGSLLTVGAVTFA